MAHGDTVYFTTYHPSCVVAVHGFRRLERAEAALTHCTGTLSPTEPAVEATWCHHLLGSNSASPAPSSTRRHAPPFWLFGQVACGAEVASLFSRAPLALVILSFGKRVLGDAT
eukprot:scaffold13123_cov71-Phaeocystis_antarctica.AAC.1